MKFKRLTESFDPNSITMYDLAGDVTFDLKEASYLYVRDMFIIDDLHYEDNINISNEGTGWYMYDKQHANHYIKVDDGLVEAIKQNID